MTTRLSREQQALIETSIFNQLLEELELNSGQPSGKLDCYLCAMPFKFKKDNLLALNQAG